jgi:hypothetical protein
MLAVGALIAALIGFSFFLSTQWSGKLGEVISRVDRLDPRWRFDDIQDDRLPVPPAERNGMEQILRADAAQKAGGFGNWSFPDLENKPRELAERREVITKSFEGDRNFPMILSDEQARLLTAEIEKNHEALRLARAMVNCPYGRLPTVYPANFWTMSLAPYQKVREVGHMLRYDALLRAHNRDSSGALKDVKAIVHAGRAVGDEPFLITMLIRIAMDQVAVRVLERTLGLGEATDQSLQEIQTLLAEQAKIPYFLIGIRGERAGNDRMLESIQNGTLPIKDLSTILGSTGYPGPIDLLLPLYSSITIKARRAEMLELMTEALEIGKLPTEKQQAAFQDWINKVTKLNRFNFIRMLLPAAGNVAEAQIRNLAVLRTAQVGVAAERYRMTTGHWPTQLADLTPRFLDSLPVDPYDGLPLKFNQQDGAFIVYTLGADRTDNGAQLDDKPFQLGSDIGFRLFEPAKRRQPFRPITDSQDE